MNEENLRRWLNRGDWVLRRGYTQSKRQDEIDADRYVDIYNNFIKTRESEELKNSETTIEEPYVYNEKHEEWVSLRNTGVMKVLPAPPPRF